MDISPLLQFSWFQPVLYLDPDAKWPESKEKPGHFVGFANNCGDALTFLIYTEDGQVLTRSVVRPATEMSNRNRRVTFEDEVQQEMQKLDPMNDDYQHIKPRKPAKDQNTVDDTVDEEISDDGGIASRTRSRTRGVFNPQTDEEKGSRCFNKAMMTTTAIFFILMQIILWLPGTQGMHVPNIREYL